MTEFTFNIPKDAISLAGWVIWFGVLVFLTVLHREKNFRLDQRTLIWLAALSIGVVLLTPFMGFPVGDDPGTEQLVHLMIFAAVPWMLAGGVLGLTPAVLLAGVAGLLLGYLDTHSIFTPLLFMTSAVVFTLGLRQRYRSWVYRLLRFPLFSAAATGLVLVPATFIALTLKNTGEFASRAVAALNGFRMTYFAQAGMVLIGGVVCAIAQIFARKKGGETGELKSASGKMSLRARFTVIVLTAALVVLAFGLVFQWQSAEAAARRSAVQKMTETSDLVTDGLTEFVSSGQSVLRVMAEDGRLGNTDPAALTQTLGSLGISYTYFDELAYVNPAGEVIAAYPTERLPTFFLL